MNAPIDPQLHIVVLAAGASRRFGSPKQLAQVDGHPLLQGTVARAVALGGHAVTVILGANAGALTGLLRSSPATILINRQWEEGLGSSLRAAVNSLPGSCDGVLIALADQVAVNRQDLQGLVGIWRRQTNAIVAANYGGVVGVPAIFPRWSFPQLAALRGDEGARLVLRHLADRVTRVPMPNAAVDIDTPDDLLSLTQAREDGPSPTG